MSIIVGRTGLLACFSVREFDIPPRAGHPDQTQGSRPRVLGSRARGTVTNPNNPRSCRASRKQTEVTSL